MVVGKQWMWKVQHPEGNREINDLHVPVGQPIRLKLTSEDVIHSFYIPAFRVKQDAVPGRYTSLWFKATKPGVYHLFCAEYCGTEHSRMIGSVTVHGAAGLRGLARRRAERRPVDGRLRRPAVPDPRLRHLPPGRPGPRGARSQPGGALRQAGRAGRAARP